MLDRHQDSKDLEEGESRGSLWIYVLPDAASVETGNLSRARGTRPQTRSRPIVTLALLQARNGNLWVPGNTLLFFEGGGESRAITSGVRMNPSVI